MAKTYIRTATLRISQNVKRDVLKRKSFLKKIIRNKRKTITRGAAKRTEKCEIRDKLLGRKGSCATLSYVDREKKRTHTRKDESKKSFPGQNKAQHEYFNYVRVIMRRMLKVRIAHGMDPIQRAGQTKESNEREASKYGRGKKRKSILLSFIKVLLKLFSLTMFPVISIKDILVKCALQNLENKYKPKEKEKKKSHIHKILHIHQNMGFAR
ncbi:MAG: hypothetical protein AB8U44_04455 [Aaplasma endosymbiont of Hyalomma asiaticum]